MKREPLIAVTFAEKCAWRAVYVYVRGRQVAHLGIDSGIGAGRPKVFVGLPAFRRVGSGQRMLTYYPVRWTPPVLHWRSNRGPVLRALYRLQSRALRAIDAR